MYDVLLVEVVSLEGQKIIWEDGGFTTCTGDGILKIPFEGFPFILLNVKIYKCEMGKYKVVCFILGTEYIS